MVFKRFASSILIGFFLIQGCGKSSEEYFETGIEHYNEQRFNEAIKLFKKNLKLEPENVKARFYLGMSYKKTGKTLKAIDEISYAAEITPSDFYILYNLADCYRLTEEYGKSVDFARRSLAVKPNFMESHLLLGIALYLSGQLLPAEKELEFMVKITQQDNPQLYTASLFHLGILYRLTKDYASSLKTLSKLSAITPNDGNIYYQMGLTYLDMNDMDNVAKQITQLRNLNSPLEQMLQDKLK